MSLIRTNYTGSTSVIEALTAILQAGRDTAPRFADHLHAPPGSPASAPVASPTAASSPQPQRDDTRDVAAHPPAATPPAADSPEAENRIEDAAPPERLPAHGNVPLEVTAEDVPSAATPPIADEAIGIAPSEGSASTARTPTDSPADATAAEPDADGDADADADAVRRTDSVNARTDEPPPAHRSGAADRHPANTRPVEAAATAATAAATASAVGEPAGDRAADTTLREVSPIKVGSEDGEAAPSPETAALRIATEHSAPSVAGRANAEPPTADGGPRSRDRRRSGPRESGQPSTRSAAKAEPATPRSAAAGVAHASAAESPSAAATPSLPTTAAAATSAAAPAVAPDTTAAGKATAGGDEAVAGGPRLPLHLAQRTAAKTAPAPPLTNADQVRLVQRVARAIHAAESRGGEIRLRLSPPELGSLRLEVRIHEGALTARVETDNALAKGVLMENLPALRQRLEEQGLRIEQFDVDLTDRHSGGGSDGAGRNAEGRPAPQASAEHPAGALQPAADNETENAAPSRLWEPGADGRLNVIV